MVREIFVAEAATTILSIPIPHSTPLGKISSFGYPMLRVFSLSNLPIERLSSMIAMGIRNCPIGRLWKARMPQCIKMLLWRIGANAIPTRKNLQRKMQHIDPSCILCSAEVESCVHLFFECHFARALWTFSGWGLRINVASLNSGEDILKLILNPQNAPIPSQDHWTISLNMALIVDEILKARNLQFFNQEQADLNKACLNVQARFQEIFKVFSPNFLPASTVGPSVWSLPPLDHIKINVDVALDSTKSALAVVARNHLGEVLFIWGKVHHLCSPMIAEASALLWTVQLAS